VDGGSVVPSERAGERGAEIGFDPQPFEVPDGTQYLNGGELAGEVGRSDAQDSVPEDPILWPLTPERRVQGGSGTPGLPHVTGSERLETQQMKALTGHRRQRKVVAHVAHRRIRIIGHRELEPSPLNGQRVRGQPRRRDRPLHLHRGIEVPGDCVDVGADQREHERQLPVGVAATLLLVGQKLFELPVVGHVIRRPPTGHALGEPKSRHRGSGSRAGWLGRHRHRFRTPVSLDAEHGHGPLGEGRDRKERVDAERQGTTEPSVTMRLS
jgi:hypothetical protein